MLEFGCGGQYVLYIGDYVEKLDNTTNSKVVHVNDQSSSYWPETFCVYYIWHALAPVNYFEFCGKHSYWAIFFWPYLRVGINRLIEHWCEVFSDAYKVGAFFCCTTQTNREFPKRLQCPLYYTETCFSIKDSNPDLALSSSYHAKYSLISHI